MDEFAIIKHVFRPLAGNDTPAMNLENDTAIWHPPLGHDLVMTKDVMVEGVHFLPNEDAGVIAQRLLRVNLSDLAASGAKPQGYLLGFIGKAKVEEKWLMAFAAGLARDQEEFHISLFGGDTVSGSQSLALSLTAIGSVPTGQAMTRGGAKPGDHVFVSGTIGDGYLGLQSLLGNSARDDDAIRSYQLPEPRLRLGLELRGLASASIDVSDGLLADMHHICEASRVGGAINLDEVPLSPSGKKYACENMAQLLRLATSGDDYELLFTVPEKKAARVHEIAAKVGLSLTRIGEITGGSKFSVFGSDGKEIDVSMHGYRHLNR